MPAQKINPEQEEALAQLRELLPVGSTVTTVLKHVSRSGMSRVIQPVIAKGDAIVDLTYLVAKAGIGRRSTARQPYGIVVGGCGMDMGFHLVYSISRSLYPDGHKCTGQDGRDKPRLRCPSNDHSNDYGAFAHEGREKGLDGEPLREYIRERLATSYTKRRKHSDGGYAVSQRWL